MAKILYVDDDLQMAGAVEDWLIFEQHKVQVAHTGFEGWEKIRGDTFDLLILDWDLPDLNGLEILKRFRSQGGKTPVLMLTGHTDVNDKEAGLDAGADDYLTKPFHMKELTARIRALLRRAKDEQISYPSLGTDNECVLKQANLEGTLLASRYEFLEILGQGGMGLVFKAMHPMLEKFVAIKMLHAHELQEETIERFKREAKAVSRLDHHNIITVHDFGVTERAQPYMVMEYIEGETLTQMIDRHGGYTISEALDVLTQACEGISHAHERGILHRDIKPGNIMLKNYTGKSPLVKILDFGFSKVIDAARKGAIDLTQPGLVMGSPPYMSPEQVRDTGIDERSDIYAMGCVIYETLTGVTPHQGLTSMEVMLKHIECPAPSMREARPDVILPPELEPIVAKALSKVRSERQQSMSELKDELEQVRIKVKAAK